MPTLGERKYRIVNVGGAEIVDNLTDTSTDKALSSNQGKELEDKKVNKPVGETSGHIATVDATGNEVEYIAPTAQAPSTDTTNGTNTIVAGVDGLHYLGIDTLLADTISPAADNSTGLIGTSQEMARQDHKHPVQVSSNTPVDITGFTVPGSENSLGINNTDDTVQKVLDKIEDFNQIEGLRAAPVADNTELTALSARNYERRLVQLDGKEYVFEFGATSGTLADDATTGFWQEQIPKGLVTTYVDSNATAFTETLTASTGAGVVRLFTNVDVTNTATLAVTGGETLNGVTDGTFLFSNYSVGTQFRADEVTNGWVVSVVGASASQSLDYQEVLKSGNQPLSENNTWQDVTELIITIPADKRVRVGYGVAVQDSSTDSNASASIAGRIELDGIPLVETTSTFGGGASSAGSVFLRGFLYNTTVLASSTTDRTIQVQVYAPTAGSNINVLSTVSNTLNYGTSKVWYEELPSTESVLAGMVTPSDNFMRAGSLFSTDDDNETFVFDTPFDTSDGTTDSDIEVFLQRKNQANLNTIIAPQNITVNGFDVDRDNAIDGVGTTEPFSYIAFNRNQMAQTVVMPDALDVEDVEIVEGTLKSVTANGTSTYLDGGRTWDDLINEYDKIRFESVLDNTGSLHPVSMTVSTSDISNTSRIRIHDGAGTSFTHQFQIVDTTTGDALDESANWTGIQVRIVGVKAQKTVINTTDTPVNDQSASGYIDIGTTRIQWGTVSSGAGTGTPDTIILPQPFANVNYSANATIVANTVIPRAITLAAKTTTQFEAEVYAIDGTQNTGSGVGYNWQAIGLKP